MVDCPVWLNVIKCNGITRVDLGQLKPDIDGVIILGIVDVLLPRRKPVEAEIPGHYDILNYSPRGGVNG